MSPPGKSTARRDFQTGCSIACICTWMGPLVECQIHTNRAWLCSKILKWKAQMTRKKQGKSAFRQPPYWEPWLLGQTGAFLNNRSRVLSGNGNEGRVGSLL